MLTCQQVTEDYDKIQRSFSIRLLQIMCDFYITILRLGTADVDVHFGLIRGYHQVKDQRPRHTR